MTSNAIEINVRGIPSKSHADASSMLRSRLIRATNEFMVESNISEILLQIDTRNSSAKTTENVRNNRESNTKYDDDTIDSMARKYVSTAPLFTFEQLVLTKEVIEDIKISIDIFKISTKVFDDWGLRTIQPFVRTALNFHGPAGTGKTLAAHSIASYLGKKLILGSYADIESKFHGDGPKNVQAIFYAAQRDNAVLFIDEAESLLSKRLLNVTQGTENAINSMRSQLLISMEQFEGVVIFATNLVQSYDSAFETRVRNIYFPLPDEDLRARIWKAHLPATLPGAEYVDVAQLGRECEGLCGRDIRNAVVDAAIRAALNGTNSICGDDLIASVQRLQAAQELGRRKSSTPLGRADAKSLT